MGGAGGRLSSAGAVFGAGNVAPQVPSEHLIASEEQGGPVQLMSFESGAEQTVITSGRAQSSAPKVRRAVGRPEAAAKIAQPRR